MNFRRHRHVIGVMAVVALSVALPKPAPAQEAVDLGEPKAQSAEPFSDISGLRQLSDGTLWVSDGLEGRLLSVSLDLSTSRPIGRVGAGPREYQTPDALFAMAADTTLMVDLGNGRLAVVAPDGAIVRTMPMASGDGPLMRMMIPGAVDDKGRIYFRGMGMGRGGIPDSAGVQVFDPGTDAVSDLTQVKLPEMNQESSGGANNQRTMIRPVPLSREDAWTASSAGELIVARSNEGAYWIERLDVHGTERGPEISYRPIEIRNADKDEWVASLSNGLSVGIEIDNGRQRTTFSRGGGRNAQTDPDEFEWPETKPAFPVGSLQVAPDGNIWLRRYAPAGQPPLYDVLDDSGRRLGSVRLPEGRNLEGFGDGHVYLSRTDDLDFVWLERYAMPSL
ncbi:MAG: hypothetical protein E4H28_03070 [Gemmatimonadales bacterium]|nr:MAG: hypothetical protein E4H28_03070 [Gemmatimonadales bacterium]